MMSSHAKYLSRLEAEKLMIEANCEPEYLIEMIDNEKYIKIREDLLARHRIILYKYFGMDGDVSKEINIRNYKYDLMFGLELYNYLTFKSEIGISLRDASNPEYWSYLSVIVIPDIVSERWDFNNYPRFFQQPSRIWLYTLWWYIHLSWQGDLQSTYRILKNNSTDTIMNLVERTSGKGYNLELYREIMSEYSKINIKNIDNRERHIFRTIMVTNTYLYQTIEPSFFKGDELGYVKNLFERIGLVDIDGEYIMKGENDGKKITR